MNFLLNFTLHCPIDDDRGGLFLDCFLTGAGKRMSKQRGATLVEEA